MTNHFAWEVLKKKQQKKHTLSCFAQLEYYIVINRDQSEDLEVIIRIIFNKKNVKKKDFLWTLLVTVI